MARKSQAEWEAAIADHQAMLIALRQRNGEALGQILRRHLQRKEKIVLVFLGDVGS